MPLIRRIPKRGFNNAQFKTRYAIVNLDALNAFDNGSIVNEQTLLESGIIRRPYDSVKILGGGELNRKLAISVEKLSKAARSAIEMAGGSISLT